jgi:glutamate/tyrosine decarboxylase-like PLP-dependent enzyme
MIEKKYPLNEENLDPQDWESMQALGYRMVDDMLDYLRTVRQRPPWQHAPDEIKAHFEGKVPLEPQAPEQVYQEFVEYVLPYTIGNIHPRFWGWFFGTGTVMGGFAEFLTGMMNTNSGDFDHHSAIHVETQVVDWLKELLGYPANSSGTLTSGCSAANLMGLAVARSAKAGFDVRTKGIRAGSKDMLLYASAEIHSSIRKAVQLLGLGDESIRRIPVDDGFRIDLAALLSSIAADRKAGRQPFCVVGAAGTVNTGAFDDLEALADICQREDLWLHVDAAFGAWAKIVLSVEHLVSGMERADSIAFDLHKWMYMPYEVGCVLVRDEEQHRRAFSLTAEYISKSGDGRGMSSGVMPWFTDYDFQLSRRFRSLKIWMSLKEHGLNKYARLIRQNIEQVKYLEKLVEATPQLELSAPVVSNVICFRFVQPGLDGPALDALNEEILIELQEQGIAVPSGTTINGRYVLRVGHTNHRTKREDFDLLVREVIRLGDEIAKSID